MSNEALFSCFMSLYALSLPIEILMSSSHCTDGWWVGGTRSATSTLPQVPKGVTWFILGWASRSLLHPLTVAMQGGWGQGRVVTLSSSLYHFKYTWLSHCCAPVETFHCLLFNTGLQKNRWGSNYCYCLLSQASTSLIHELCHLSSFIIVHYKSEV